MAQTIIVIITISIAVFFIAHRIYKKFRIIKRGEDICKSNDCDGCSLKQGCNKNKKQKIIIIFCNLIKYHYLAGYNNKRLKLD